jgi:osmotically-inducible protein OsmY
MRKAAVEALSAGIVLVCTTSMAVADQTTDVDNTKQNRDYGSAPTAQNQSNKKTDVKQVAALRRALMKHKGLSTNAQNIKIVSEKGNVFLRGPVNSLTEKQIIDNLAAQTFGGGVTDELEVKESK